MNLVSACGLVLVLTTPLAAWAQSTSMVSVNSSGQPGTQGHSFSSQLSPDGRFVVFASRAKGLVAGLPAAMVSHIYLRDRQSGQTTLISVSSAGVAGNQDSLSPAISDDGRYVVFQSDAMNLAPDNNVGTDIFVRDRLSGTTTLVSRTSSGNPAPGTNTSPSIAADGTLVSFSSNSSALDPGAPNALNDVFVVQWQAPLSTVLVSATSAGISGNGHSSGGSISADGRYVAFESASTNLVPAGSGSVNNIFVRDLVAATTVQASVGFGGQAPDNHSYQATISPDGSHVVFYSAASNLIANDSNGASFDVFIYDLLSGSMHLASVSSTGLQSGLGSHLGLGRPLSRDGRHALFYTNAALSPADLNGLPDCYLHDRVTGTTELVSVNTGGIAGDGQSTTGSITADGGHITFESSATDLGPPAVFGFESVYIRDHASVQRYCTAKVNSLGCTPAIDFSGVPHASQSSGFVVSATNVRNNKSGLLLYSTAGRAALPFSGGFLCVAAPVRRTPVTTSGGSTAPVIDCSGIYRLDLCAFAQGALGGSPQPALSQPSTVVNCEWWGRDPGFAAPDNVMLSDALEYLVTN